MKDKFGTSLSTMNAVYKALNRIITVYLEFIVYLLRIVGFFPSHHLRRVLYRIAGMRIGKGSAVHMGLTVYDPRHITIGEDTIIGEGAVLDGRAELFIGNHVAIASNVMIYNAEHDINDRYFKPITQKVKIGDYVFIGPRAIILPGVTVGQGAVIGAGAVVTKDVEMCSVVAGVPAKEIKKRSEQALGYVLGRASWFR